jgi:hypothetical protein
MLVMLILYAKSQYSTEKHFKAVKCYTGCESKNELKRTNICSNKCGDYFGNYISPWGFQRNTLESRIRLISYACSCLRETFKNISCKPSRLIQFPGKRVSIKIKNVENFYNN